MEWIRRRRAYIINDVGTQGRLTAELERIISKKPTPEMLLRLFSEPRGPFPLWLFGERGVYLLNVFVPANDVVREYEIPHDHPSIDLARRLFPEAMIFPFSERDGKTIGLRELD